MNNKMGEWTSLILDELKNGEWRDYPQLVAKLRLKVPPGYAYRVYENHYSGRKKPTDKSTLVTVGQSLVIRKAIYSLYVSKKLEIRHVESEHKRKAIEKVRLMK